MERKEADVDCMLTIYLNYDGNDMRTRACTSHMANDKMLL